MKNPIILAAVLVAVAGVLWLKFGQTDPAAARGIDPNAVVSQQVLLFADLREATAACGCAEIIRLARATQETSGVAMREFDTRHGSDEAKRYQVMVSPTVIIAAADGSEQSRFEGESADVIAELRTALAGLGPETEPGRDADTR